MLRYPTRCSATWFECHNSFFRVGMFVEKKVIHYFVTYFHYVEIVSD